MKVYLIVSNYYGLEIPIAITLDEKLAKKYAGDRFDVVPIDFNKGALCHFGDEDRIITLNYLDEEDV